MRESMVCISFQGIEKARVEAFFLKAGLALYDIPDPSPDMIVLYKHIFEDYPKDYIKFLFDKLDVWDISWTGWTMSAWVKNNGPLKEERVRKVGHTGQWLWRVYNMGWPVGHEDSTNEWGNWNLISHEDAMRLSADDDNQSYEFVPYLPVKP